MLLASIGWFRDVLPARSARSTSTHGQKRQQFPAYRKSIEHIPVSPMHRKIVPVETFQFTTGLKGGIAGGTAMILPGDDLQPASGTTASGTR